MSNSKRILGYHPNSDILIIEQTKEACATYKEAGGHWGASIVVLRPEHLKALQEGKALAWNDGDRGGCCEFVILEEDA